MNPELDARLCTDYPLIFKSASGAGERHRSTMASPFATWHFECGDGWYDLINALCLNLQHATKNGAPQAVATQVKEKFGALRFYAERLSDEQAAMVQLAETISTGLCEVCGNRGRLIRIGGIRTRCAEHEKSDSEGFTQNDTRR
jgi:hypothetical protein